MIAMLLKGRQILRSRLQTTLIPLFWLMLEKGLQLVSGVLVGFWVVRTLGPQEFGHFSAAVSVTAVFGGLATMGLETVLLRRLAATPASASQLLRSAVRLRTMGSAAYVVVCGVVSIALFPLNPEVAFVAALIACSAFLRVTDVIGLWMQTENRYDNATAVRIFVRIVSDAFRIVLILQEASMYWFATGFIVESAATGGAFYLAGRRLLHSNNDINAQAPSSLLKEGWPILISGIVAGCYARIDQVLLYSTMGATENGYYAAAVRISEVFNLLILSIGVVAAPYFGRLRGLSDADFDARLLIYNRWMLFIGLLASALTSFFADSVVRLLYGSTFAPSVDVLRIHAWTIALIFASVALEPWFYHYGKLSHYITKTFLALGVALPITFLGTRFFGPTGTATAVLITYAFSVFATNALLPETRAAWRFQKRMLLGSIKA